VTLQGGVSKNVQFCVTSFLDDPLGHQILQLRDKLII
jgi:hypothetical protein